MISELANSITVSIISAISDNLSSILADEIVKSGTHSKDEIQKIISQVLTKELPALKSSTTSTTSSSSTILQPKPAAPKSSSSSKGDHLRDSAGNDVICDGVKKSGEKCTAKAKYPVGDKNYCGVHHKSNNKQADPNKAPTASTPAPNKGGTSFLTAMSSTSLTSTLASFDLGNDNITDL